MNAIDTLTSRLNALSNETAALKKRMGEINNERSEIETALRTIGRYTDTGEKSPIQNDKESVAQPSQVNFMDAILTAIKGSAPLGMTSSEITKHIKDTLNKDIKSSTLSVMLQRHKDRENICRNGKHWFLKSSIVEETT